MNDKAKDIISYMKEKQKKMFSELTKDINEEDLEVFFKVVSQMISNLKIKESEKNV